LGLSRRIGRWTRIGGLDKKATTIVTKLVKAIDERVRARFRIRGPMRIISGVIIKSSRVPSFLISKENRGISIKLLVGIRAHAETSQAVLNNKRDDISFGSTDRLSPVNKMGLVIHDKSIVFKLARGMNGRPFTEQGILMKYCDDRTPIGLNVSADSTNADTIDLVVVNALNINGTGCFGDKTDVITSNPAVTPAVN
jgi:hypothetical protein